MKCKNKKMQNKAEKKMSKKNMIEINLFAGYAKHIGEEENPYRLE